MIFEYELHWEPIWIEVTNYRPEGDMIVTGWGYGDAIEGDEELCEWQVVDQDGTPRPDIEAKLSRKEWSKIDSLARKYSWDDWRKAA